MENIFQTFHAHVLGEQGLLVLLQGSTGAGEHTKVSVNQQF